MEWSALWPLLAEPSEMEWSGGGSMEHMEHMEMEGGEGATATWRDRLADLHTFSRGQAHLAAGTAIRPRPWWRRAAAAAMRLARGARRGGEGGGEAS